jgi:hypothetical protein
MARDRIGQNLTQLDNCPHCGVANPNLMMQWSSGHLVPRATPGPQQIWAAYACTSCGGVLLAKGVDNSNVANCEIVRLFPESKSAHIDIPDPARTFLSQAYKTLHAPDAAAVMAGSSVDAMLRRLDTHKEPFTRESKRLLKNIS